MRNLTIFGTNYSFRRLREKVNKNDWKNHGAAAVVNAFYSPLENSIRKTEMFPMFNDSVDTVKMY